METSNLKKFARHARRSLHEQVEAKLQLVLSEASAARRESPKVVAPARLNLTPEASTFSHVMPPHSIAVFTATLK